MALTDEQRKKIQATLRTKIRRQDPSRATQVELNDQRERAVVEMTRIFDRMETGPHDEEDSYRHEVLARWANQDRVELGGREPLIAACWDTADPLPDDRGNNACSEWRTATGEPVAVYGPREQIAAHARTRDGLDDDDIGLPGGDDGPAVGLGAFCRAMVAGPRTAAERRALVAGTDSAGGYTVPEMTSAQLLDRMRAKTRVIQAGALTVPMESGVLKIAKIAGDIQPSWLAETVELAETEPTFGVVKFEAKTCRALVTCGRELLEDSVNVAHAIETSFAGAMGVEVDRVALLGAGTPTEPLGLANTPGVHEVSMGADGGALEAYDPILDARLQLLESNADEPSAAIMAPRTSTAFAKLKDNTGQPLRRPTDIEKLPFLPTTSVPIDDAHGAATAASRILTGVFPMMMIGVRTALRVELLKERYAHKFEYGFLVFLRLDVALVQAGAFSQVTGIVP